MIEEEQLDEAMLGKRLIAQTRLERFEAKIARELQKLIADHVGTLVAAAMPDPFDLASWPDDVRRRLAPVLEDVIGEIQERAGKKYGLSISFSGTGEYEVNTMLDSIAELGGDISDELRAVATQAVAEQAANLDRAIDTITETAVKRARTIARNQTAEFLASTDFSTGMQVHQAGVALSKTWVTIGDDRVRRTHREANGQTQPMDGYFEVGGQQLEYPHDPSGSAKETANCRCQMITDVA